MRRCFHKHLFVSWAVAATMLGCSRTPEDAVPTAATAAALPPADAMALEPRYRSALADIGLVLTSRGGLIDRSHGGYEPSPTGTHLALYLEPANERSIERYVDGIVEASRVFLPEVFERWPGLESFDVCQEPRPTPDQPKDPPPVTQIEVTRTQAAAIDWETITVREIVDAARDDPPRLHLVVNDAVRASDAYANVVRSTG